MEPVIKIFPNGGNVAQAFADFLAKAIEKKSIIHVALSGGSTPALLFDILAEDYLEIIDWKRVHFYWGDERCVPPDHKESNYKMTYDRLLSKINIPESNIHRVFGENDPDKESIRYGEEISENLTSIDSLPHFDIIILGMGGDGHTASIFPHQMDLLTSGNICDVAIHPDSGQKRVTLSGPVINNAETICFLVTGASKKEKVTEIFQRSGEWESYPAAHISPDNGTLYWFLDESAAP